MGMNYYKLKLRDSVRENDRLQARRSIDSVRRPSEKQLRYLSFLLNKLLKTKEDNFARYFLENTPRTSLGCNKIIRECKIKIDLLSRDA